MWKLHTERKRNPKLSPVQEEGVQKGERKCGEGLI